MGICWSTDHINRRISVDPQRARLFSKAKKGKAVLFIGAGASHVAGAPLGGELAAQVHQEFLPGLPNPSQDLIEVCSKVLDTPGVDRATVEEFIRSKLDFQPSPTHRALCRNRWQAIFTTNYDDLIETAYRTTPDRRQRCDAFFGREFSRSQSDYIDVVRLTAVQNRHKSNGPRCKRELCGPGTGILKSRSAPVS
jgi:hypothetical protein